MPEDLAALDVDAVPAAARRERQRTGGRRQRTKAREVPMKITTIALDEETHAKLRHVAVDEKTSLRELLRQVIADYLARRERR
jgi:hypothetical protein